jgi:hypothetical protein
MNVYGGLWGSGISRRRGRGKEKYSGVKRMEKCNMCTYEDSIMKPIKNCLKERRGRNRMEI